MSEAKQVEVKTASNGFYIGFNKIVAISSKVLMGIFIVLIAIFPSQANAFFQSAKGFVPVSYTHLTLPTIYSV